MSELSNGRSIASMMAEASWAWDAGRTMARATSISDGIGGWQCADMACDQWGWAKTRINHHGDEIQTMHWEMAFNGAMNHIGE
jgi:hypothetical protein